MTPDFTHGTLRGYITLRCRCEPCRLWNRDYCTDRRIEALRSGFAGREHGTAQTYKLGCRCRMCRAAKAARHQARKDGTA